MRKAHRFQKTWVALPHATNFSINRSEELPYYHSGTGKIFVAVPTEKCSFSLKSQVSVKMVPFFFWDGMRPEDARNWKSKSSYIECSVKHFEKSILHFGLKITKYHSNIFFIVKNHGFPECHEIGSKIRGGVDGLSLTQSPITELNHQSPITPQSPIINHAPITQSSIINHQSHLNHQSSITNHELNHQSPITNSIHLRHLCLRLQSNC